MQLQHAQTRTFDEADGGLAHHAGHLHVHPVASGSLALEHANHRVVHLYHRPCCYTCGALCKRSKQHRIRYGGCYSTTVCVKTL
jgi:hypothetical protein